MTKKETPTPVVIEEKTRRLSLVRVLIAFLLITGIVYGSATGWKWHEETQVAAGYKPWFASYVDVTSKPRYAFEQLGSTTTPSVMLAFIVSSKTDACTPSWGAYYTLDEAGTVLDLDRRIARLQQQGGGVAVSFGGFLNDELSLHCTDPDRLLAAYKSVIERYDVNTIDLDLENAGLSDADALVRRAQVIAKLQSQQRAGGKSLAVWLTLPVAPQGLPEAGTTAVAKMLEAKVDLAGVNVMTMDYNTSKGKEQSMADASQKALTEAHRQLGVLYKRAGIELSSATLWKKMGATPMIGQNDIADEIFSRDDAIALNKFAQEQGVGRMSMWSANRDIPCGENYVDVKIVSDSCSGVKTEKFGFASALSTGFDGNLIKNAEIATTQDPQAKTIPDDDPAKSPYQIWQETGAYLEGVKVVWHGNVYQAKWWTKGNLPDNPVLQSWETPWQLIGPVLHGEKPVAQPTLPPGTYPEWSGTVEYQGGQRVLFEGTPFQAKWWNQGQSPAAATSNADSSAWVPLTQAQMLELVGKTSSASAEVNKR